MAAQRDLDPHQGEQDRDVAPGDEDVFETELVEGDSEGAEQSASQPEHLAMRPRTEQEAPIGTEGITADPDEE
ncbi:hypothetical protein A8924_5936 [Saccharopolyspora erythraea NRRL 2338]|uniref:Uncharacterized protein n=2 Tax=Saccharopolyspora erythraea TaxID=1836 RepID=A4FL57_SACEN|nr:hypothetical protein [Saccharopolyspora erythraea]EQD83754.1 hypothetical protein N599_23685 [Saccharopolyspora erythraea D]PFG98422.1 hypothetical protein A8924_5936 [Saccharopolyspora erythraea NRRL 2338]QRK88490.1 hypothetical protein JQX30_28065 [Saccharopolyspora erythraea]CAM04782.1 hypothetical protein SACE_5596 [Saccharopolyspora erythraea NRRL 2338]